jgi:hypothetical protein
LSPGTFVFIAVPSMGKLSGNDYQSVALAADQLAEQTLAVALLDPPDQLVTRAGDGDISGLTSLASGLRAAMASPNLAMLSSTGLLDKQNTPVAASTTVAAMMKVNDSKRGYASSAGGLAQPVDGLTPAWSPSNSAQDALTVAGIDTFVALAGYGTVLWGDRTLEPSPLDDRYIGAVRTITHIHLAVSNWCQILVFARNDPETWDAVEAATTGYLDSLWKEHYLAGSSPSDASQVSVGLGSTMTAQDVADGIVKIQVSVEPITPPYHYVTFTYQQNNVNP